MLSTIFGSLRNRFYCQRTLFVSIFWGSLAGVFSQGLNFITNIILARFLSVEYGTFVLYGSTNSMLQGFSQVGLNVFATVLVAQNLQRNKIRLGKLIPTIYFIVISLTILVSISSLFLNYFRFGGLKFWNLDSPLFLFFVILWFITSTLDILQVSILSGFGAFKDIAKVSLIKGFLTFIIVLFFLKMYGIQGVIIAYALSFTISLIINFYFIRKNCRKHELFINYELDYKLIKHILKSSFPIFLATLVMLPTQWGINYVIYNKENGKLALTVFGIANQWMLLIQFFPSQIAKVILPLLSGQKNNKISYKSTETTGLTVSILITISLILISILFEPYILKMYHLENLIAKYPYRVMLLAALFSTVNSYLGLSIIASGQVWTRTVIDVFISLCLFVSFLMVLTSSVMLALPIAYCLSFLLGSSLLVYLKRKNSIN